MRSFIKFWQQAARKEFIFLLGLGMTSVCLWGFFELTEAVTEAEHHGLEERIMRSLRQTGDPSLLRGPAWLKEVARDITALGGAAAITFVTLLTACYFLLSRRLQAAGFVVVSVTGGYLLGMLLKHIYGRPRPAVVPYLVEAESSFSFPSGHSMSSAVAYITLGALLARGVTRWRDKFYLIGSALLLSGLIGVSRVLLGVHYPTDVLAGWVAGTAWALLCWMVAYRMNLKWQLLPSGESERP
jgi:undecaprenyl-diphosphatase